MKVLLAEDDQRLQVIIRDYFQAKGQQVVCAGDGEAALALFGQGDFDAVLLDVMMPRLDGFETGKALRRISDVPLVFLTARMQEEDQLRGFALGADDYITKPFSLPVLYAKVEALIRRSGQGTDEILTCGRLEMHTDRRQVFVDGRVVVLAPKAYELLLYLVRQKGRIISRQHLLDRVWGIDYEGSDRVVDSHIKKLRKALGTCAGYIRTVTGTGYGLEVSDETEKR